MCLSQGRQGGGWGGEGEEETGKGTGKIQSQGTCPFPPILPAPSIPFKFQSINGLIHS